jgi:hypothetical protein
MYNLTEHLILLTGHMQKLILEALHLNIQVLLEKVLKLFNLLYDLNK